MPDTGSAKIGLVGNCALCLQSGHCLCSQEPPVAGAAAHSNFFCCPDFVVWPSPCSASAVERRGQGSATIQRSFGFNFCLQQALKTAVSPWIYCSATCTAARQWQKKRTDPRAMTFCTTSLTQAQQKKKKNQSVLMFMFLLGYPEYPLLSSGKKTAEEKAVVGRCYHTNSAAQFRGSLQ